jgi:hypothetical protein
MNLLGSIVKNTIQLRKTLFPEVVESPYKRQKKQLLKLLRKAQFTSFGLHYQFHNMLGQSRKAENTFRTTIPVFTYNTISEQWWHKSLEGKADVCWPGSVKYFALSSGTSETASKRIPITKDILKSIKRTTVQQILHLTDFGLPDETFSKGALLIGGSTALTVKHKYYEGDLSGISAKNRPLWFRSYYKPGNKISKEKNWEQKLQQIIDNAPNWDIGFIVGIPSWVLLLLERIKDKYQLNNIHDMWPNLHLYIHSGVAFEPYRKKFDKLFGHPVAYMEAYLASEGYFAYQTRLNQGSMNLQLSNGIFYEFVPFDSDHFDTNGDLINYQKTLLINEVKPGVDYATIISTCAGSWRYLIGDVIKFTDVDACEIVISGRTKHFLSITGEHLSLENMSAGITLIANELNIDIEEYTVCAENFGNYFAHRWYIGCDDVVDKNVLKEKLDLHLRSINDDYDTERTSALKEVFIELLPNQLFLDWLKKEGKIGAQIKFPRVLKGTKLESWKMFLKETQTPK